MLAIFDPADISTAPTVKKLSPGDFSAYLTAQSITSINSQVSVAPLQSGDVLASIGLIYADQSSYEGYF